MLPGDVAKIQVCSVLNHETTSGNLMSRYLKWKIPVHNVCLTKEGCQVCYDFNPAFLVMNIDLQQKGQVRRPGPTLFLIKWYSYISLRMTQWPTSPNFCPIICHICPIFFSFFSLQCPLVTPPGYTAERTMSDQPVTGSFSNHHQTLL